LVVTLCRVLAYFVDLPDSVEGSERLAGEALEENKLVVAEVGHKVFLEVLEAITNTAVKFFCGGVDL